jgi:MFS family permease
MIAVFVLFLHGIGIPLIILSRTIYIQKSIPDYFRGRVFSMVHMSVMGTTAISIAITGVLLEFIDADFLFLLIGLFASSSVIIGLKTKGFLCLEDNVN